MRVAIVGCGRIAQRHAKILSEGQVEGVELVALCDILPHKAHMLSRNSGLVPYYVNMDIMIPTVRPDLIAVCTPSGLHYEHILRLAHHGVPLLVEKPLCLTLKQVDHVAELGIPICEVKQNRYNIAVQHLKSALDEGRLGTPHMASVRVWWARDEEYYRDWHGSWAMAGGVLANQAIHHVDLLQWLMGPVRQVSAFVQYSGYTEVETGLTASLEFESGAVGTLEATTLTQPCDLEGSLAILGNRGTVELGGFAVNEIRRWELDGEPVIDGENPPDVYGFGHIALYNDLANGFPIPPTEARKALEICHAIYESVETGRVVELGGEYPHSRLGREN